MKHWKSKLLAIMLLSGVITILVNFNFAYWGEMAPIYLKGLVGRLPVESDGLKLPPLPNPFMNNRTILGLDEDKNGIRDDVDYWIAVNGVNYNERMAIREKMKVEQKLLYFAEKEDIDGFQDAMRELWVADNCQGYISYAVRLDRGESLIKMLKIVISMNTEHRQEKIEKIASRGYLYEAPIGKNIHDARESYKHCNFKISDLNKLIFDYRMSINQERKKWGYEK